MVENKKKLLGNTLAQLKEIALSLGLPAFTGKQLADWLYKKKVTSIDQMTNLSKAAREKLSQEYIVGIDKAIDIQASSDGTKKYLFPCHTGSAIEAVMIPDADRATICVSSQAGCKMGCKFCMTGRQGFKGNLETAEIISQFISIDESDSLTNAVFMGMGEPLDNMDSLLPVLEIMTASWGMAWSPKRITVSTVGKMTELKELLDKTQVHIAISVHSADSQQRGSMMPVEKAYPINGVMKMLASYDFSHQRRLSLEYIMWRNVNDDLAHADMLVSLIGKTECRVNLIRFHSIPGVELVSSSEEKMIIFRNYLNSKGVLCTIRASRGEDIMAACGMLAGKGEKK